MKLKRAYIYCLSFIGLSVMFSTCYYLSYLHALSQFNRKAVERIEYLIAIEEKNMQSQMETSNDINQPDTIPVDIGPSEIILPSTKYILEILDVKTNTIETQNLNPPAYLVGLSREEVINFLNDYMNDMTLSEYNKGLIAFDLLNFSSKEVVLRKSYNDELVPFRYYLAIKDGYVVVYYSDLKSVFDYTHIEAAKLQEEDRIALSNGIYVNSLEELYSLLESYTS